MLVAADYDTHDCIGKFARRPRTAEALSLEYLLKRTRLRVAWDAGLVTSSPESMRTMMELRVGADHERQLSIEDMKDMPEEERVNLYVELCKADGFNVSVDDLLGK